MRTSIEEADFEANAAKDAATRDVRRRRERARRRRASWRIALGLFATRLWTRAKR